MTNHVEFPGLGLSFTLNRVAFTLFGMPVYWYGILIASGLLLALLVAFWKARSYGIDADRMVDVIFGATVCAIIGGRAYYVATAPFEYESFAQMLDIRLGGVGIYGAIIAAFVFLCAGHAGRAGHHGRPQPARAPHVFVRIALVPGGLSAAGRL